MDRKIMHLLDLVAAAMRSSRVDYAIGGALAMSAHGYKRHTSDVDLFALEKDRMTVLRALRAQGLVVTPVFSPHHYIAQVPEEVDMESRIDVLFPSDDLDLSAIEFPDTASMGGLSGNNTLNIWPLPLIVIAKFYSERPKDHLDIAALLERGLFEPKEIEAMIRTMDAEGADEFADAIKILTTPRKKRAKPTRKK